ncbi:MAG TPA: hypothetical protein VFF70_14060 [Anaerolineae bacterium]|jgi:hypothetical protein|nr:hypothetical protein [Anaerolineae bacterium]
MSLRKASVLEMATAAYELDASVRRGLLRKIDGKWTVMGDDLDNLLNKFDGQEVVLIAASLSDERPLETRTCRTCGREYVGLECPHCRDARIRLRGR